MPTEPGAPGAHLQAAAILSTRVTPRRVYVRDPAGVSLLRGEALLVGERTLGGMPLLYVLRLGAGVEAVVLPCWVTDLPAALIDNVRPFPGPVTAPCR